MVSIYLSFVIVTSVLRLVEGQSYVAEGYFIVDDETVKSYIKNIPGTAADSVKRTQAIALLKKDINYVLFEVNNLFKSFHNGNVKVELKLFGLNILNTNVFSHTSLLTGTTHGISTESALTQFDQWLQTHNVYNSFKYDFTILWTGFDLNGPTSATAGYAHVGKMCDPKLASGVVEFDGTYGTIIVTAHEIGHILGSEHGGPATNYIMATANSPNHVNRWSYSNCSITDIKENLATFSPNCLLTSNPSSTLTAISYIDYDSEILDPHVICQRKTNDIHSYMCTENVFYNNSIPSGDNVCSQIYCSIPGNLCLGAFTSEGMVCDSGKRCIFGKCVPDSTAPRNIDSHCVYGDQKVLELTNTGYNGTCIDHLTKNGYYDCYNDVINQICCSSCKSHYTGHAGCEYGDKGTDCAKYQKDDVCPNNMALCCGYCYGYIGKRSQQSLNAINITLPSLSVPEIKSLK